MGCLPHVRFHETILRLDIYDDIIPVSNVARMLAAMEAITGSLFVAVLIARLVALYSSERLWSGGPKH